MKVLVTGGAGYIGSHTCKRLAQSGHSPITIDNLIHGHRELVQWGPFVEGDIGDEQLVGEVLRRYRVEAVLHFAAFAYVGESVAEPMKYYNNNVRNALGVLNATVRSGIRYFIFSSTCATYGNPCYLPMDEEHQQSPINPYGASKLMVERILRDYESAYGLRHVNLRYFNAAGADPEGETGELHRPETHLIPLVLDAVTGAAPPVQVFGNDYETSDGTCVRDYIHVSDLAAAHVQALQRLASRGGSACYNLGTGRGSTVREIIDAARMVTGREVPFVAAPRRAGDPPELVASPSKAASELGWQAEYVDIREIIATAWEWHQRRGTLHRG